MFKNIEKFYKKESVHNKILKRITICFIISVLTTWSLILLNMGYLSVIIPIAVFFIVKRICEKHLKTKLYYKLFPSNSFLTLEELSEQKEKEMFKKYTINKKMYNEIDLKNIIHHYRGQQVTNKKDDKFLEVLLSICSIIIPLLQSKNVENIVAYIIAIIIAYGGIYYFYRQIKNMLKSLNGEIYMYERLEEIFSELLNDLNNENNLIKKEKQNKKNKSKKLK